MDTPPPLESVFPGLKANEYEVTSPADPNYNCLSWALGDVTIRWDPYSAPFNYWPRRAPTDRNIESLLLVLQGEGFERCDTPELEDGWEKVAIFVDEHERWAHVARQLPDGAWSSKIGSSVDIRHLHLNAMMCREFV